MTAASRSVVRAGGDSLILWAERAGDRLVSEPVQGGLRFAFYGRVSTEDHRDPVTSRAWQHDQAGAPVAGHGRIDHLRSSGRTLTYDPQRRTLRTDTEDAIAVTIGHSH